MEAAAESAGRLVGGRTGSGNDGRAGSGRLDLVMARAIVVLGVLLLAAGLILAYFPRALSWFGNLPGDIDLRRGGTRVMIPITSTIVLSLGLTLLLNLAAWILRQVR
jgi:hypothetical protein